MGTHPVELRPRPLPRYIPGRWQGVSSVRQQRPCEGKHHAIDICNRTVDLGKKKNPKNPYQGLAFLTEPGRALYYRTGPSLSKAHATAPQQPGPTQAVGGSGPLALCGFPTALWCSRPVSVRDSCDSISQRALGCLFFQGGNEDRALLSDILQESSPPGHHSKKETVCEKPMPFPASVHSPRELAHSLEALPPQHG